MAKQSARGLYLNIQVSTAGGDLHPALRLTGKTIRFKIIRGNHQSVTIDVESHNHIMTDEIAYELFNSL